MLYDMPPMPPSPPDEFIEQQYAEISNEVAEVDNGFGITVLPAMKESNGHHQAPQPQPIAASNAERLAALPKLKDMPSPSLTFEQMKEQLDNIVQAKPKPPKRKIKTQIRELIEPAAHLDEAEFDELGDYIEELVNTATANKWLTAVKRRVRQLTKEAKQIEEYNEIILAKQEIYKLSKVSIILSQRHLDELADEVMSVLKSNNKLYCYGDAIVRISQGKKTKIVVLNDKSLPLTLSRSMYFYTETRNKEFQPATPAAHLIHAILNHDQKEELQALNGLTYNPILLGSHEIEAVRGYLPQSQYYNACDFDLSPQALNPKLDDLNAALDLLDDLLAGFPFVDMASKTNTLAMMLQSIIRHYIDDICPLYVVNATTEGTGKTYLAECCAYMTIPDHVNPLVQAPSQEDEWRKQITTFLQSGSPFVVFDNVEGYLKSSSLTRLLTTSTWTDRILGVSEQIDLPVYQTFALTSNNANLFKDIISRSVYINLDANMERPWQRTFERDIKREIKANRQPYTEALLTIVSWWLANDAPLKKDLVTRYKRWEAVTGGILEAAGIPGFCENINEQESQEISAWKAFACWWWDTHQDRKVTASGLLGGASYHDDMQDHGKNILGRWINNRNEHARVTRLGVLLDRFAGRVFNGLKIIQLGLNHKGSKTYYLRALEEEVGDENSL